MGKYATLELKSKHINQIDILNSILFYWDSITNEWENNVEVSPVK